MSKFASKSQRPLPSTHTRAIFVLYDGENLPPFTMSLTAIGTEPNIKSDIDFVVGNIESNAMNVETPILVHWGDAFKITKTPSWPVFISALVCVDSFPQGLGLEDPYRFRNVKAQNG